MLYYILTNKRSFPSAKLLRNSLEEFTGDRFLVASDPEKIKTFPVVRYGNSSGSFKGEYGINSPEFIRSLSNKRKFSELLLERDLYAPEFFKSTEKIGDENIFPIMIRTSLFLSGGKGISLCNNKEEFLEKWNSKYHWTRFVPLQWELRMHILGGKVAKIFRKTWEEDTPEPKLPIRNNSSYSFKLRSNSTYPKLLKLIPTINEIFGTDSFYALDIGWDTINKEYFFIEGNTAPGLNENTAKEYAEFILKHVEL